MNRWFAMAAMTVIAAPLTSRADEAAWRKLVERADRLRPSSAETRWMQIPWIRSVVEAEKIARTENRPIMYWHVDDDPLERC